MKVSDGESVAQIRHKAQLWYDRQVKVLQRSLGPAWSEHEDWVTAYLRQELREALIARGWRPRDGG
jgi:hypothetical protein